MLKQLLLGLILTFSSCVFAQNRKPFNLINESEVTSIAYWNQGESVTYQVNETERILRQKKDKKKEVSEEQNSFHLTLSVLDSTQSSYQMEGFYTDFEFEEEMDEMAEEIIRLTENIPIVYHTDEFGKFDSLYNVKSLQRTTGKMVDEIMEMAEIDSPFAKLMMKPFTDQLLKEENQAALFCSEILSIHLIQGGQWKRSKEYIMDCEFVTMNSYKVEGQAFVELKKIDTKNKLATFKVELLANEEQISRYIQDIFVSMCMDLKQKFDAESFRVKLNEKMTFAIDLETGWPRTINSHTEIKVRDFEKKFIKEIEKHYVLKN
ncbi:MAG: hypothetical protein AAF487_04325 [Bacteroidota bacterium]